MNLNRFILEVPGEVTVQQRQGQLRPLLVHRPGAFALLSIGKGRLGLLKYGPTHIEFDTPDPDGLYQRLKEAGLPVEEPPALKAWGEYDFTIHDPDGHCLEFDSPYHQRLAGSNPEV